MSKKILLIIAVVGLGFANLHCAGGARRSAGAQQGQTYNVPYLARGNSASLRQRVLVLPFLDQKTTRSEVVVQIARSEVLRELLKTRQFVVVNNNDLGTDLGKFINEKREYDLQQIAPIAANMGIAAIIEGKVLDVKARRIGDEVGVFRQVKAETEVTIRVRVVSARNGREILKDIRRAKTEAKTTRVLEHSYSDRFLDEDPTLIKLSVKKAFRQSVLHIVKAVTKLSWAGRVAKISGERVYVNAGRLSGLQMGDILKVTDEGEEIYDPDNGKFIGRAPGRMKGTVEVVSYFGKDGSIAVVHSGSGFKENDRIELY